MFFPNLPEKLPKMGYKLGFDENADAGAVPPCILKDNEGTTSWRDAKKALRGWYLDQAKALRSVTEKEYFKND